jgi:hypothetical protein
MTSNNDDDASEVETCSDLFYPVPRCIPENLQEVVLLPHYGIGQPLVQVQPTRFAADLNEMTVTHFCSMTGLPRMLLMDIASADFVDPLTPLSFYGPRLMRMM